MVNEDILTGLKNAIDHGDSVESAVSTAISSGYNPKEVEEAAQFIGQGTMPYLQTRPEEHLVMPNKKSFLPPAAKPNPIPTSPQINTSSKPQQIPGSSNLPLIPMASKPQPMPTSPLVNSPNEDNQMNQMNQIKREISPYQNTYSAPITLNNNFESTKTLSQEIKQMSPKKPSYIKEIILGIILLILLGVLGATILLKDVLLEFFSSL